MSGGVIHVDFADGRSGDVDESDFPEFERRASAKGLKFTATGASGSAERVLAAHEQPAPEVAAPTMPQQAQQKPAEPAPDDRPWYQRLQDAIRENSQPAVSEFGKQAGNLADTAGDAASRFNAGLTAHMDELLPFGAGDAIKADRELASQRSPGVGAVAEGLGAVASPAPLKGATVLGKAAAAAGNVGGYAAAKDFATSEDPGLGSRAWHAVLEARKPATMAFGLSGVASRLAEGADKGSVLARRYAMGGTEKDYGDIVKEQGTRRGIEFLKHDLGRMPEEQGLTNIIIPQSKADLAVRAADRRSELGRDIGASLEQAGAELPSGTIDRMEVIDPLSRQEAALRVAKRPGGYQLNQAVKQAWAAPLETPADLAQLKREYEAEAYSPTAAAGSRESRYALGQKAGADAARSHLRDVMDQTSVGPAFAEASKNYGKTRLIEKLATRGAVANMAAPAIVGAGAGGAIGYETRRDWPSVAGGALAGAVAGALGKDYAPDLAANVLRLGERGLNATAEATPGLVKLGMMQLDLRGKTDPAAVEDEQERKRREAEGR